MNAEWPRLVVLLAFASFMRAPAHAQPVAASDAPDTQQMIEALTPRPDGRRTRSSRNLIAREKHADAAASAAAGAARDEPPSISLSIAFAFDSARLEAGGRAALDHLAAALQSPQLAASRFLVQGHTDARGGDAYNRRLSQARADEVSRYLRDRGVEARRLEAVGVGSDQPADAGDPFAAENRRVRVVNIGTSGGTVVTPADLLAEIHRRRVDGRTVDARATSQRLRIGHDSLELRVTSQQGGHVYVALAGSDGRSLYLLYPNALDAENRIAAGQTLSLPRSGWEIAATGPSGRDTVLVLVSDTPRDLSGLAGERVGPFMKTLLDEPGGSAWQRALAAESASYGSALLVVEEVP